MIRGRFLHRSYAIGDDPVLDVHADCRGMLEALGLIAFDDAGMVPGGMELFLIGREYPKPVRVSPLPDIAPEIDHALKKFEYRDWYGKGASLHDRSRNRAVLYVPGMRNYNPDFVSRGIVRPLLDLMLVAGGYIPLHAAAVAGHHAMLLSGKPGAGKTSLLMGLLERDFRFLADDRAVLTEKDGKATVHRFPEYIRSTDSDGPKRSILPDMRGVASGNLRLVVFIEPDGGRNRIERITPSEGAARFLATIPQIVDPDDWATMSDAAVSIASIVPMRVLRGWNDMRERIGILERLLIEEGVR